MMAWTMFFHPMTIPTWAVLWLILPLCLAVAVVYKTIRVGDLSKLPRSVAVLVAYMVGGLTLLSVALWLIQCCLV